MGRDDKVTYVGACMCCFGSIKGHAGYDARREAMEAINRTGGTLIVRPISPEKEKEKKKMDPTNPLYSLSATCLTCGHLWFFKLASLSSITQEHLVYDGFPEQLECPTCELSLDGQPHYCTVTMRRTEKLYYFNKTPFEEAKRRSEEKAKKVKEESIIGNPDDWRGWE